MLTFHLIYPSIVGWSRLPSTLNAYGKRNPIDLTLDNDINFMILAIAIE